MSAAIVLATLVTLAAVIPLGVVAFQARGDDGPAPSFGLIVTEGGVARPLSGAVIRSGEAVDLHIHGEDIVAAAWVLYAGDGELIAKGNNVGAPPYEVGPTDPTVDQLDPGLYDLLVTTTNPDGTMTERAARFAVETVP
jgi:hypothetical protein